MLETLELYCIRNNKGPVKQSFVHTVIVPRLHMLIMIIMLIILIMIINAGIFHSFSECADTEQILEMTGSPKKHREDELNPEPLGP